MALKLPNNQDSMKTVDEIAADLHVHRITVYRLLKAGKIPGFKVGRVWRFRMNEVREWIEKPARRDGKVSNKS